MINKAYPEEEGSQQLQSVRYLEDNQIELFKAFKKREPQIKISRITFVKYLKKSGNFKKPHRLTDMCEYCEKLKKIKQTLPIDLKEFKYHPLKTQEEIDYENAKKFLNNKQNELHLKKEDLSKVF